MKNEKLKIKIQLDMEAEANRFNVKCLGVLCAIVILCAWLNRVGVFTVDSRIMSVAVVLAAVSFAMPITVWGLHDWILAPGRNSVFTWAGFKYLVIIGAFFGITATCVVLSFHAVLLMVLPGIFAAQYSYRGSFLKWVLIATVILVPLVVYGGFFFGLPDQNYFPEHTPGEVLPLADRIALCPPQRLLSLFEHYVVPRFFSILVIDILLSGVIRRNADMTLREAENAQQPADCSSNDRVAGNGSAWEDAAETEGGEASENGAERPMLPAGGNVSAKRSVRILTISAFLLWVAGFALAALSQETGFRILSAGTGLAAFLLITVSRDTQGHYRNISSAYRIGALLWLIMEAVRLASDFAAASGTSGNMTPTVLAIAGEYLSFLPNCLFVVGLIFFAKSEYNQLHFRRMTLHAFTIAFVAFMIVQKLAISSVFADTLTDAVGPERFVITLYFFMNVFSIVMVLVIFIQTKFKGHTFRTDCSAVILVIFNLIEIARLYYMVTGNDTFPLAYETVGPLGLAIYAWAQSDPILIYRKSEPDPIRPSDHVRNRIIWGTASVLTLFAAILFVTGFFDSRDLYLTLLAVLLYIIAYKSVQAGVYNSQLVAHQREENRKLERLVQEKTAELKRTNDHLRIISGTDELTGLYNRRYGMEILEELARAEKPYAFLLMDLNHFKQVNDRYGHDVGDEVLKETGNRLSHLPVGIISVRLGGDEFLLIVHEMNEPVKERGERIAAQICRTMDQPIRTRAGELTVTACIGIAVWPEDTFDPDELYRLADQSMYGIKHRKTESAYCIFQKSVE